VPTIDKLAKEMGIGLDVHSFRSTETSSAHDWTQDPTGGVTYHGYVPDTDPRYKSGWNFLSGKNLSPPSEEKFPAEPDQDDELPPDSR
jgi:hypothetical protein